MIGSRSGWMPWHGWDASFDVSCSRDLRALSRYAGTRLAVLGSAVLDSSCRGAGRLFSRPGCCYGGASQKAKLWEVFNGSIHSADELDRTGDQERQGLAQAFGCGQGLGQEAEWRDQKVLHDNRCLRHGPAAGGSD